MFESLTAAALGASGTGGVGAWARVENAACARRLAETAEMLEAQRRAEALGVLAHGGDRLVRGCALPGCPAGQGGALSATVVHVIAEERSLADDTAVCLDGEAPPRSGPDKPLQEMTIAEALAPDPPTGAAPTNPAVVIGAGIMSAPLLAATVAGTATIRPGVHPGDAPRSRATPRRVSWPTSSAAAISPAGSRGVRSRRIAAIWTTPFRIRWGRRVRRIWRVCVENIICSNFLWRMDRSATARRHGNSCGIQPLT